MYSLSDILNIIYDETGLKSDSAIKIARRVNDIHQTLCASKSWNWKEDTYTITTLANTSTYSLPVDIGKVQNVYVISGGNKFQPLREIVSNTEFLSMSNVLSNAKSDYPQAFRIYENQLQLVPKFSSAGKSIVIEYHKKAVTMDTLDYSTGSISVTNGDETVTGTGTSWSDYVKAGDRIQINDNWYTITSVTSTTALELTQKYQGDTETGISDYRIGSCPIIPDDFQSILWKQFCEEFYIKNKDTDKMTLYKQLRLEQYNNLVEFSSSNSTKKVWVNQQRMPIVDPNFYGNISYP